MLERSLVLIKHDSVLRGLIGKIISRLEETGLKIIGIRMVLANGELAKNHYELDKEWARKVYEKTKKAHEEEDRKFEYDNAIEFGSLIQKWNIEFLKEGPIVAIVVEGPNAIEIVRKLVGHTEPRQAAPGTIRGDFAMVESYKLANVKKRVIRNLVHASDSIENAKREIDIWFKEAELYDYSKELDKYY